MKFMSFIGFFFSCQNSPVFLPKNSVNLVIPLIPSKIQNVCSFSLKSRLNVVSEPYDFVM